MPEFTLLTAFFWAMLLLFCCNVVFFHCDILEPAVVVTGVMTLSAFLAAVTQAMWSYDLTEPGFLWLSASMLAFSAGSIFASWHMGEGRTPKDVPPQDSRGGWHDALALIILTPVLAILAWQSYEEAYALSVSLGNMSGPLGILGTLRPAMEHDGLTFSRWMVYRQVFAQIVAVVSMYIFLRRAIYGRFWWGCCFWLVPVVLDLPFMVLTTGRLAMVSFGIASLVMGAVLYEKKHGSTRRTHLRVLGGTVGAGFLCLVLFLLMGFLTGKGLSADRTPFVVLAHYMGVSIPAFGVVADLPLPETGYPFANTLVGPYRIASYFLPFLPKVDTFLSFVYFDGIDTNVYTTIWRYLLDFGHIGMLVFMALFGGGYTLAYHYVRSHASGAVAIMLYAVMAYPIFLSSISEHLLFDFGGTTTIYDIVLIFIVSRLLLQKRRTS